MFENEVEDLFCLFYHLLNNTAMADNNNKPEAQAKQQKAPKEAKPKKKGFNLNDYPLPEYVQHRLQVWDEVKKSQEAVNAGTYLILHLIVVRYWILDPRAKEADQDYFARR